MIFYVFAMQCGEYAGGSAAGDPELEVAGNSAGVYDDSGPIA